jgi:hypothetical protein
MMAMVRQQNSTTIATIDTSNSNKGTTIGKQQQ